MSLNTHQASICNLLTLMIISSGGSCGDSVQTSKSHIFHKTFKEGFLQITITQGSDISIFLHDLVNGNSATDMYHYWTYNKTFEIHKDDTTLNYLADYFVKTNSLPYVTFKKRKILVLPRTQNLIEQELKSSFVVATVAKKDIDPDTAGIKKISVLHNIYEVLVVVTGKHCDYQFL